MKLIKKILILKIFLQKHDQLQKITKPQKDCKDMPVDITEARVIKNTQNDT